MSVDESLLFIDANKYLDLYRMDKGKELLVLLEEQVKYIFVTEQVFNEVQRNKLEVAAEFLTKNFKDLKLELKLPFKLPDHLSSTSLNQRNEILQEMTTINQNVRKLKTKVDALELSMMEIMEQISCSKDEVSKALFPIFTRIVSHSPEELQKARNRKELGNPPGKKTDPIGDQLTWEQILTHFTGKKRLWIISRDIDYGTSYGGKRFLNCFLYDELCKIASKPEVYLFDKISDGIPHFVETTGVKAEKRLTPEEAEEIEKEEKSLSDINQANQSWRKALENLRHYELFKLELLKQDNLHDIAKDIGSIDLDAWCRHVELYRQDFLPSSQEGNSEGKKDDEEYTE